MQPFNEKIIYENPLVPMKIYLKKREVSWNDWHYHKQIELLYIVNGKMDVLVDRQKYTLHNDDVVLIGANQLHRDYSYTSEYIVFHFDPLQYFDPSTLTYMNLFSGINVALNELNYIFYENPEAKRTVSQCIVDIYREAIDKNYGYDMAISLHIRRMLLALLRSDRQQVLSSNNHVGLDRLKSVMDYIENHFTEKITVTEASSIANISYSYFATYFKKVIGMTFVDYVNYHRIKLAERILLTEDISVEQIGEKIGMENTGHFYKMFRKFNQCSPNDFRKKMTDFH
ncbi:helix-turn-helix domain-containing protein [Paenibacillus sp. LMG 31456]|uniref:Helix-turn-helix domain-containing protein n=1 Tax=Paenibacillus foliorum TaxID=2654974 RepID=A0A972H1F0_9BACL|nr:AraC family transcriptional regulator [Paenibacillus foliorum]NOU94456.1 helix-turn-helix domain-containing protein [Paenibacillus foliorum]